MRNPRPDRIALTLALASLLLALPAAAERGKPKPPPRRVRVVVEKAGADANAPDRTLYTVATAHLDTQWLWTIQDTITTCIPDTMRDNFALFERYPDYEFNFEGSFRYQLMKEYYPEDFERLKRYVKQGRWHVCGSSVDAGDTNIPSPESLIRHVLYANRWFREELGVESTDIFLPDCFGFSATLPTVAKHCGLTGFSTQKLTWGSSVGIPFPVGVWEGVDGSPLLAALDPGEYVGKIRKDLSQSEEWLAKIDETGGVSGAHVGYHYYGTGDRGGAPDDESVKWLEKSLRGKGPVKVVSARSDQMFRDLTPEQVSRLPRYQGELLMTRHGVGCYTSQAVMKRWNRKNEQLAYAAEAASVVADWMGALPYPREKLREAWTRFLWHHHHDDVTGTSTPLAYPFSWNDEVLSMKAFADVLTDAVGAVSRGMDTQVEGVPVVVFNALAFERQDVVEAVIPFPEGAPQHVRVFGPDGAEVPSQVTSRAPHELGVLFLADVPSVGFAVFDVRRSAVPGAIETWLSANTRSLENGRWSVELDENGDIAQIATVVQEMPVPGLLSAPARWQLLDDRPEQWSEWEISFRDAMAPPREVVGGPARVRVVEHGPVRVAVEVERQAAGSTFVQRMSLEEGSEVVEVDARVDWQSPRTLLKAEFPLAVSNLMATYDLGIGTIDRGTNTEKLYEVPAQQWADVRNADGSYAVAILSDSKQGWDRPDQATLRLTLIHGPHDIEKDRGWHRFRYAIVGHHGDWRDADVQQLASRFNESLAAFSTSRHPGLLGRQRSFLRVWPDDAAVMALKKSESGDQVVLRIVERFGEKTNVAVTLADALSSARLVTGQESPIGDTSVLVGASAVVDLKPHAPVTLALTLVPPREGTRLTPPASTSVPLPYDTDVASFDHDRADGDFDGRGRSIPAELLPDTIDDGGIRYTLGPKGDGKKNAVTCRGQSVALPPGDFDHVYVLAAAVGGSAEGTFALGGWRMPVTVREWTGFVGQSQSLVVDGQIVSADQMEEGYIAEDRVAWVGTHRHSAKDGNEPYVFCYLFRYALEVPEDARGTPLTLKLPENPAIRVLAVSAARDASEATSVTELVDELVPVRIRPKGGLSIDPMAVTMTCDWKDADIRYTMDGSIPTESSAIYSAPISVARDTTLRARAFVGTRALEPVSSRVFRFTTPRPAARASAEGLARGLDVECFEGEWRRLSEMTATEPVRRLTAAQISLEPRTRDLDFGLRFTGFVEVPRAGVYTFTTRSDDGSTLAIGDQLVVDNDGLHGAVERRGQVALAEGLHPIAVLFFQRGGDLELSATWEGPGVPRAAIPASALFR